MKPELLQLDMRVQTPSGSGRVRPFFDEDPDIVVCPEPAPGTGVLCRVKLDESGDFVEVKTDDVEPMAYT